ncbi:MAG: DoxX family protein [Candidatus Eisenbacteria bacterium]
MNRYAGVAHALLRIVAGLLLFQPGAMKMFGWYGGMPPGVALSGLVLAAGIIEIVAGPLLMLGLGTRPVAFLASGEMAVAYFYGHFPRGFWPIQNHGEPAVLLSFIFLYLAAVGAGPYSIDALIARRRAGRS